MRRKNLAKKMLDVSIDSFERLNVERIFLEVAVDNDPAIHFYKKLGFEVLNTIKSFYSDGTSAYAMQKVFY